MKVEDNKTNIEQKGENEEDLGLKSNDDTVERGRFHWSRWYNRSK